jgi:hypothetical protein
LVYAMDCCLCKIAFPAQSKCEVACSSTHLG